MAFDPATTALVLIDLQNSNLARQLAPHSADEVLRNCLRLADAFRAKGGTVVFVRVLVRELQSRDVDAPFPAPAAPPPAAASELSPQIRVVEGDVVLEKRQWGAFYGTALEQVLRRRNIKTIVLGGIATNFGVETTARAAMDRGYDLFFAEDAMSSVSEPMHRFTVEHLFPRIGKVRSTGDLLALCG